MSDNVCILHRQRRRRSVGVDLQAHTGTVARVNVVSRCDPFQGASRGGRLGGLPLRGSRA